MQQIKILSKKEIKNIKKKLNEQWGFTNDLNFTFLISSKGRINIVKKYLILTTQNSESILLAFILQP